MTASSPALLDRLTAATEARLAGDHTQALTLVEDLLADPGTARDERLHALADLEHAKCLGHDGQGQACIDALRSAAARFETAGTPLERAETKSHLSVLLRTSGRPDAALEMERAALAHYLLADESAHLPGSMLRLGVCFEDLGQLAEAAEAFRRGAKRALAVGDETLAASLTARAEAASSDEPSTR